MRRLLFATPLLLLILSCAILRPTHFSESEKIVLLTFDDGPNADHAVTERLLDVLRRHRVKAVFNVIGRNVARYPELVKEARRDGHIIANHGNTQWPLLLRGGRAVGAEFDSCDMAIGRAIDEPAFRAKYFRPSFGWYGTAVVHEARKRRLTFVGVTWYGLDEQKPPSSEREVLRDLLASVHGGNGGVTVLHDGKAEYTHLERRIKEGWKSYDRSLVVGVADSAITILKREGYRFPSLDDSFPGELSPNDLGLLSRIVYTAK